MESPIDAQDNAMLSLLNSFRSTNCIRTDLLTPPSSPERQSNGSSCDKPCLSFQKLLKRSKKLLAASTSPLSTMNNPRSDSFAPSSRYARFSVSPFRAVKEMKQPFPLILPDSPTSMDERYSGYSSTPPQLRKIAESYRNLRALAEMQPEWRISKLPAPLLPSPAFLEKVDDDEEGEEEESHEPRSTSMVPDTQPESYVPYEDHRIVSSYCREEQYTDEPGPAIEQDEPSTPQKRDRTRTYSEESDWLAGNQSHEQRKRKFHQRCFQIVQHPMKSKSGISLPDKGENQIMLATVLVGPGKPKLIQISRPPSMSLSTKGKVSPAISPARPVTPIHNVPKETSAFSPYDTPSCKRLSLFSPGMIRKVERHSVQSAITDSSLYPAPLRVNSCRGLPKYDSAIFVNSSTNEDEETCLNHSPAESLHTFPTASQIHTSTAATRPHHSNPVQSPTPRLAALSRCRTLERTINAITQAVESFPDAILRLDSPVILELRNPHIPESVHLKHLERVLPSTSPLLLTALAAWLIIDDYFTSLNLSSDSSPPPANTVNTSQDLAALSHESLHYIPEKARATLGIDLSDQKCVLTYEKMLRRRAQFVHISVGVVGQRLMQALRGRWDEGFWTACRLIVGMVENGGVAREMKAEELEVFPSVNPMIGVD